MLKREIDKAEDALYHAHCMRAFIKDSLNIHIYKMLLVLTKTGVIDKYDESYNHLHTYLGELL